MSNPLLYKHLQEKILIMDGAMGTMLQKANLTPEDFGGDKYDGCNEILNITKPEVILNIHSQYLQAGADIIETNTFGATSIVLSDYELENKAYEFNVAAAKLARQAADSFSTNDWPRFVAGSMGPTTKTLSVTGGTTFNELRQSYYTQALGLIDGKVDILVLETCQDLLNVKAAYLGIEQAFEERDTKLPIIISGTIEPMGTTLAGQSIEAFYISVEHMKPLAVGLNCATGPEFMQDHLRSLSNLANFPVSCYPNAGLPDEEGNYNETPSSLAKKLSAFAKNGWLNIVGGCCGTTPEHIEAIAKEMVQYKPREIQRTSIHKVSGIEPLIYDDVNMRPLLVGERTNVIGSRKFKNLISEGKYEEAAEIARAQVKNGAHVIDVCLANPDRNELEDMENFLKEVTKKIKAPFVVDSTDIDVIEKALTYCQGKSIINSINLEDGEEKFAATSRLAHQFGASIVVGTIDEKGMGVTLERKLEIAKRSYDLLVEKYGIAPEDIIFDPLVFPVGTGDEQYIGSAKATVDGIKQIKAMFPASLTILGISNVSFGLPPVGREVLNSVFLYHCTQAGLDYAIVNTEKLERFASISDEEIKLAEELLFHTSPDVLSRFTDFYRDKKKTETKVAIDLPLEERLANYVVEGTKEGLIRDLQEALEVFKEPLAIINGPLMNGMQEVGRLFNNNELIVAEVLQSAEVMKAAVSFLEQYMEINEATAVKGKIVLATVKGDVHDIGKNLVDIILSNNGFEVIDLGIKVTSSELIEAIHKEKPDFIGLSGLLVKSAQQMVLTAQDLKKEGINLPILVGGAALTRKFTDTKINKEYDGLVLYAKDAMDGLRLANLLQNEAEIDRLFKEKDEKLAGLISNENKEKIIKPKNIVKRPIKQNHPIFIPNDTKRHIISSYTLKTVKPYINMQMLLGHHLGVKGKIRTLLQNNDEKAVKIYNLINDLIEKSEENNWIEPKAVYQFFPAQSDGDKIFIYNPEDKKTIIEEFHFPRQTDRDELCLADFLKSVDSEQIDYVGFFAVTAGKGIRTMAEKLKEEGKFLESHALSALALETAEGLAELVHQHMRAEWGFPDRENFTMEERFAAKYQGQRFSFGYPACPNLEDQKKLFSLIKPEHIGIELTDGFMMDPEASVTAIVLSHPEARYFNV